MFVCLAACACGRVCVWEGGLQRVGVYVRMRVFVYARVWVCVYARVYFYT